MNRIHKLALLLIVSITFVMIGAVLYTLPTRQSVDIETLEVANRLYTVGNYPQAIRLYEQIVEQGIRNPALYYNLGNAYFQIDDYGHAILNYQRAAELAPRDREIRANLILARNQSIDAFKDTPNGPLDSLSGLTSSWLSLDENAVSVLAIWFALTTLLFIYRQLKHVSLRQSLKLIILVLLLILLTSSASLGSRIYLEQTHSDGIITAPVITVSSDPDIAFGSNIQLHQGTQVELLDTLGDWVRISLPGNIVQGWIPLDSVEAIV